MNQNHSNYISMTRIAVPLAKLICRIWKSYEQFRYKINFDYYIEDLKNTFSNSVAYHTCIRSKGFYNKSIDTIGNEKLHTYRFGNLQITISRSYPYWGQEIWNEQKINFVRDLICKATNGQSLLNKEGTDEQRKGTS